MKLDLTFSKFIIKPFLATGIMALCSYAVYFVLGGINAGRMVTIIALAVAVIVYILAVIALKVFTKEEIYMIPYGQKLYKILTKIGVY